MAEILYPREIVEILPAQGMKVFVARNIEFTFLPNSIHTSWQNTGFNFTKVTTVKVVECRVGRRLRLAVADNTGPLGEFSPRGNVTSISVGRS